MGFPIVINHTLVSFVYIEYSFYKQTGLDIQTKNAIHISTSCFCVFLLVVGGEIWLRMLIIRSGMVSVDNNNYYQVVVDNLNLCVVLCIKASIKVLSCT